MRSTARWRRVHAGALGFVLLASLALLPACGHRDQASPEPATTAAPEPSTTVAGAEKPAVATRYSGDFVGRWNPPYAAKFPDALPALQLGVPLAGLKPDDLPGPVRNITAAALQDPTRPLDGAPTAADVPAAFRDLDDNPQAERMGTTVSVPLAPFPKGRALWLRNTMRDELGRTSLLYLYLPNGIPADDSRPTPVYVLVGSKVAYLVVPPAAAPGASGPSAVVPLDGIRFTPPGRGG